MSDDVLRLLLQLDVLRAAATSGEWKREKWPYYLVSATKARNNLELAGAVVNAYPRLAAFIREQSQEIVSLKRLMKESAVDAMNDVGAAQLAFVFLSEEK